MSAYVPVDLQREVRTRFTNCCAYCCTAEELRMNRSQLVRVRRMWAIMGEHPPGIDKLRWETGEREENP